MKGGLQDMQDIVSAASFGKRYRPDMADAGVELMLQQAEALGGSWA